MDAASSQTSFYLFDGYYYYSSFPGVTERLGESWAILFGYSKIYACCQQLDCAVEAALDLKEKSIPRQRLEEVEAITV